MKKPNRISLSLFDEELKSLINASAKIFPITQDDIDNNNNPNNYEYSRVDNSIYRWDNGEWQYIIADDIDVNWIDIKDKPTSYPPSNHSHNELHTHTNKSIIDIITSALIDTWNTVTGKADKTYVDTELANKSNTTHNHDTTYSKLGHAHDYSPSTHNHDLVYSKLNHIHDYSPSGHNHDLAYSKLGHDHDGAYYKKNDVDVKLSSKAEKVHTHSEIDIADLDKYTKGEVDNLLSYKSNTGHKHIETDIVDLDKYTKSEIDTKLSTKSNTNHTHSQLHEHSNKTLLDKLIETESNISYDLSNLDYIEDIRNGYTEGHSHDNFSILQSITSILIDGWNSAVEHIHDSIKHITSGERTLWNTVSNKSDIGHVHDYSPNNHNHDTRYYTETEINNILDTKSNTGHVHLEADITDLDKYTKLEVDNKLSSKANTIHTHDDRYYTESEINTKLSSKADNTTLSGHTANTTVHVTQIDKDNWNSKSEGTHTHNKSDITDLSLDWTDVENKPLTFNPSTHTHTKSQITDFPVIPSKTSQLANDSGYITAEQVPPPSPSYDVGTVKPIDGSLWIDTN